MMSLICINRKSDGFASRGWLRLLLLTASLLTANWSFSQTIPIPPDLETFYPLTPLENEMLVYTREGCGMFTQQPSALSIRTVPNIVATITDNWKRYSWEGVCNDGLALGQGYLLIYDKDVKFTSVSKVWALRGRAIGLGSNSTPANGKWDKGSSVAVHWKGTSYYKTTVNPSQAGSDLEQYPPFVSFDPPDPRKAIRYTLYKDQAKIVQMSLTDKYMQSGNYFDRLTNYPCTDGCDALWAEKSGPILSGFSEFYRQHLAEIDTLKASLEPIIKPLREQWEEHEKNVKRQQQLVLATQKRQQQLNYANQSNKPIASPALDELIRKTVKGGR